jgi:hypothetical protein
MTSPSTGDGNADEAGIEWAAKTMVRAARKLAAEGKPCDFTRAVQRKDRGSRDVALGVRARHKWLVAEGNACLVGPNATAEEAYVQQAQI